MMEVNFTEEEKAVLFGTWLGDGHIQKRNTSYRTKIHHGYKQQDYVLWKYKKLKRLCLKTAMPKKTISKNHLISYYFFLDSGFYLKKYHELFYKSTYEQLTLSTTKIGYKKCITPNLISVLPKNPLLLAVWYMDDGHTRTNAFSGKFGTYAFSKKEHILLQDYLFSVFNITTNIVLASKERNQYYLAIPAKNNNFHNFVNLITPFVLQVPSLIYKIKKFNH